MLSIQREFGKQNNYLKNSNATNLVLKSKSSVKPEKKANIEGGKSLQILTFGIWWQRETIVGVV